MKKLFTIFTFIITVTCYSQVLQNNFNQISVKSNSISTLFNDVQMSFSELKNSTINEGGWAMRDYYLERNNFNTLSNLTGLLNQQFFELSSSFSVIATEIGIFDGSYSSLSGLPSLFDGNFSSLSGTPTTLAGYGITDLQINSVSSELGNPAISINSDGDVSFANGLRLNNIYGLTGNPAFNIDLDGNVSFANGLRIGDIYSGTGNPAFFIESNGNVNFVNPLPLQSINSYVGNPAISISSDGDVGFFNPLILDRIDSYAGNPAISISSDGDVSLSNDLTVEGDVVVSSDARLKANIISLGSTLSKLLQIDGKSYTMKKDESEKQKIGLLAQDIEKVFPELVSESHGIKSVNYQGLVPVLINALKEQEERIKRLEELLLN